MSLINDGWTTAQIAAMAGVSVRRVNQRLAEARELPDEEDREEVGDDDAEWLELVDQSPADLPKRGYYDLATDYTPLDGTGAFVFIGQGRGGPPRRNRLESGPHGTPAKDSTKYEPPDDGLKGGKGC